MGLNVSYSKIRQGEINVYDLGVWTHASLKVTAVVRCIKLAVMQQDAQP